MLTLAHTFLSPRTQFEMHSFISSKDWTRGLKRSLDSGHTSFGVVCHPYATWQVITVINLCSKFENRDMFRLKGMGLGHFFRLL